MSSLLRRVSQIRTAPALRGFTFTQKANLTSGAAKDPIGPVESMIALGTFTVAILGPSGWVLTNLEYYKKKAGGGGDE